VKNSLALELAEIFIRHLVKGLKIPLACAKETACAIEDYLYDRRLGIETRYDYYPKEDKSFYDDEVVYKPTSYRRIKKIVNALQLGADDVFIDLGCGKGRVIFFVATRSVKKVIGVELRKVLAMIAKVNLERVRSRRAEITIVHGDAANFNIDEGTIFFMYDPFGYKTFARVIENIRCSLIARPRKAKIVYFDPRYLDLLNTADWLKARGEIDHSRIFVWENKIS